MNDENKRDDIIVERTVVTCSRARTHLWAIQPHVMHTNVERIVEVALGIGPKIETDGHLLSDLVPSHESYMLAA